MHKWMGKLWNIALEFEDCKFWLVPDSLKNRIMQAAAAVAEAQLEQ